MPSFVTRSLLNLNDAILAGVTFYSILKRSFSLILARVRYDWLAPGKYLSSSLLDLGLRPISAVAT